MPKKQYSLLVRLGGSCFGGVAIFIIGIAAIFLAAYIIDLFGVRIRP